jgi:hydroxyacylglutathione hydrolase
MKLYSYALGQLQANCYFLVKDNNCLIIDPADSADFILEEIQRKNLNLVGLVATHGHFDHIMAVGEIQLSYPNLPLYIHSDDLFLAKRLKETAKYFLDYEPAVIPIRSTCAIESDELSIHEFTFEVIRTPGHTPGSCSFYFEEDQFLFSGDTLFSGGVGRYDFKYSDKSQLKHSIEKLLELPDGTEVYSGHGEETTIYAEKEKQTLQLLQGGFG